MGSLFVCQAVYGQFIPYSQYHNAPLLTNPAAPALTDYTQVTLHYRRSRVANYDIPSVSFMTPFYRQSNGMRYGGIGANIISQQAGPNGLYKVTGATGTFAYTIHLSKTHHIGAGIGGGIINKRIDASGITTDSQYNLGAYDPSLGNGENIRSNSVTRPVINAGFNWVLTGADDLQKASLGVAAYSMNKPSYDLLEDAAADHTTYVVSGEVALPASDRVTLIPTFRYTYQGASLANVGARISYVPGAPDKELSAGLWYKTTKALVVGAQYNYKAYIIGASMDFSIASNLDANINNAVEIVLGWRMNRKERLKSRGAFSSAAKTPVAPGHEPDSAQSSTPPAPTQKADTVQSSTPVAPQAPEQVQPTPEAEKPQPPVPSAIAFEPGSNKVPAQSQAALEDLATLLKDHPEYTLKIIGHSAALGERPVRERVSYERAQAVAKILIEKGVPERQLELIGMGDRQPIASNATDAGRQKNRRVEFEWIKK
ncbi:PorP/SprF family type IX secretion system membrane protein [Fulvivirgaceae bacterium PWU5]|uniref:PorP/SprF family type IX secretion system membrane protein n=1 Tax=Dawidia cretensis TaxID=2782350 RepID=A0AAP2DY73_9BACT|nr:PorP/SprF family type IX secretion system membrane protein [Dawidia cretensis]